MNTASPVAAGFEASSWDEPIMKWAQLQYPQEEVNKAGKKLVEAISGSGGVVDMAEFSHAMDILSNFRAAHAFPLNTLQNNLRHHSKVVDQDSIIAQRLKRFSSIYAKLQRFKTMRLAEMQDIAGCRTIVHNVDNVRSVVNIYKAPSSRMRHKLAHEDDYIQQPRSSGYRGYHLVYRYYSDHNEVYNGLKVEMQIRTILQHAWATAVETVDAFTQQALKSSSGHPDWERFFQLMGSEMAFSEDTPLVANTPTDRKERIVELKKCVDSLQVKKRLSGFRNALRYARQASSKDSKFFLLSLDTINESLDVKGYSMSDFARASSDYLNLESKIRETRGNDAVLVSVDSIHNLERAYPNYFADTEMFLNILDEALKSRVVTHGNGIAGDSTKRLSPRTADQLPSTSNPRGALPQAKPEETDHTEQTQ